MGLIRVSSSSLMDDSTPLSAVVGRDTVRCVTRPLPQSWIAVDLLDKTVLPTEYSVRHYSTWDSEALRSWRFEGSTDGERWTVLREHVNDETLNGKGATATWKISNAPTKPCRMFRIVQTGENSNKHHYLALSGFELYGRLFQLDGVTPYLFSSSSSSSSSATAASSHVHRSPSGALGTNLLSFRHVSNFDTNGILYYLATAGGTRPWTNPAIAGLVRLSASGMAPDSQELHCMLGTEVVRCVTMPEPNSWMAIDFVSRQGDKERGEVENLVAVAVGSCCCGWYEWCAALSLSRLPFPS